MKTKFLLIFLFLLGIKSVAQVDPLWIHDTTFVQDLYTMKNKFQSLSFTGYLQVQYQFADTCGINSFNGGNFPAASDNRFMIRRGRFRLDYSRKTSDDFYKYYFALQFDGTERGVNIRDMFGRIYENKWNFFVATVGVFNRPFSYELNYSSSLRESPERGRMSQILMKTERDIGAMVSFEPQDKRKKIYPLKIDVGVFNGQGLAGTEEYDSFKEVISRISVRKIDISQKISFSGGLSYLNGGFRNGSRYFYRTEKNGSGQFVFTTDTAETNIGKKSPRIYYGADIQFTFNNLLGKTELRGEYITGTQSATYSTSVTPPTLPLDKSGKPDSIFIRKFDGAYFYLLHTFMKKHQLFFKYDWYDPNIRIKGKNIIADHNFGPADVRFDTFGAGYIWYLNEHVKIVLYYEHPVNEKSGISGYKNDLKDNTYTCRIQFRF